jgi:hypothetical protein
MSSSDCMMNSHRSTNIRIRLDWRRPVGVIVLDTAVLDTVLLDADIKGAELVNVAVVVVGRFELSTSTTAKSEA